jgi:peptidoglycan/xylan/chitin deacetylase (PgdA/CDA1 family)
VRRGITLSLSRSQRRPLILCYHAVDSAWHSHLSISEELFVSHMAALEKRGYVGLTFVDAERLRAADALPKRSVVVTFDDGYATTMIRCKRFLDAVGFPATVFVVTSFVESGKPMCWPGVEKWTERTPLEMQPLNWPALVGLVEAGWEVGSHTVSHPLLTELEDESLGEQLAASRLRIIEELGACETIAYPYGVADERVAIAAAGAGYIAGCTLKPAHRVDEPYRRPRVGLFSHDRGLRQWAKLSPTVGRLRRTRLAETLEPFHVRHRKAPATPTA